MMSAKQYLNRNTLKKLKSIKMNNPFKEYRPLDKGNSKLEKSILSFSLLPVVTCRQACPGCYDLRSLRYRSVRLKRKYNTWLTLNEPDQLKEMILKQIINSKTVQYIRIHVGGEFYSKKYLNLWGSIRLAIHKAKPEIGFYTYTKTGYGQILRNSGINCIESKVPGLGFNFGSLERLKAFQAENPEYSICPATLKKEGVRCGLNCFDCMNRSTVLFVIH